MGEVNFVMIKGLDKERIFTESEICRNCNGSCCKHDGCAFSPQDFYVFQNPFSDEERYKYLKHFLKRGYASIAFESLNQAKYIMKNYIYFPGDLTLKYLLDGEGALYIRMRNRREGSVSIFNYDLNEGGCVFLTENGCKLSFEERPRSGRELIPNVYHDCISLYSEYQAAIDWYPYQRILYRIYQELKN